MSDQKISGLPDGAPGQTTDLFVIARGGSNYKLAGSALGGALGGSNASFFEPSDLIRRRAFAPVMATPPATPTDTGSTQPSNTTVYGASSTIFRYSNVQVANLSGAGGRDEMSPVKAYGDSGDFTTPPVVGFQEMRVEFDIYAQKFWIAIFQGSTNFRVWVDEELAMALPQALGVADTTIHYYLVDLGDAAGRGYHRIMVEFDGAVAGPARFNGIAALTTDSVYAPSAISKGRLFVGPGDSIPFGTWATLTDTQMWRSGAFGINLGWLLGLHDVMQGYCLGGTGFLKVSGTGSPKFRDRIPYDLIPAKPDAVLMFASTNDSSYTHDQVYAEVVACYNLIKASLPTCKIGFCGPLDVPPAHKTGGVLSPWAQAVKDAAATLGANYIDTDTPALFTGTGNVYAPTGDGNADYYAPQNVNSSEGPPHPNQAGHDHLARWLAPHVASWLNIPMAGRSHSNDLTWVVV